MSRDPSWAAEGEPTRLEKNWLFELRKQRYRSRLTGKGHDYFVMHLADAVNVIAVTDEQELILVRQFRAGSQADSLEPPGGLLNPGEDPLMAGARELLEETGYAGDPGVILGTSWSNPSILSSRITTILIENARLQRAPVLDESEELTLELKPASQILAAIRLGEIDHALAVGGLLLWSLRDRERAN